MTTTSPQNEPDDIFAANDDDDDIVVVLDPHEDDPQPEEDESNNDNGQEQQVDPEADAKLAAALQAMENQKVIQQPQQIVVVQQQPNVMFVQQQGMIVTKAAPGPNASAKEKYTASIKDEQHNKCSCGASCKASAYMASMAWLLYDLIHSAIQVLIWLAVERYHEEALPFALIFTLLGISNILGMHGVANMIKWMVIFKAPCLIISCIMVWAELGLMVKYGQVGDTLLACLVIFMLAQLVVTGLALKDLRKIYKWMKYYEGNGPFTYMLP